jgi:hypothetical protein
MRLPVLLLGCVLALASHADTSKREMWVWVDAQGVTHYSDRPAPGAKRLEMVGVTPPAHATPQPATTATTPAQPAAKPATPASVSYQSLEIWQPENGASFFGADATVTVRLRSAPEVAGGDVLRLYLDGKLVEGDPTSLEYTLTQLERGAHSVTAVISDYNGNEKIRSEPRVFHIRQSGINNAQNVGPALRPVPPKPTPRPMGPGKS